MPIIEPTQDFKEHLQGFKKEESKDEIKARIDADEGNLAAIKRAYMKYKGNEWYKEPTENKSEGNSFLKLNFDSEKTAVEFANELAKENPKLQFIMLNEKQEVIGYADGSGLFHKNDEGKSFDEVREMLRSKKLAEENPEGKPAVTLTQPPTFAKPEEPAATPTDAKPEEEQSARPGM